LYRSEVSFHKAAIDEEQMRYSGENEFSRKKRLVPGLSVKNGARFSQK